MIKLSYLIELKNLSKIYRIGDCDVCVLHDINLQIAYEEMIAIVGASGSGKSTMMNIIGLLDKQTRGEYYLKGKKIASYAEDELAETRNKTIGFVFQSFFLLPRLNAVQNVAMPLLYRGVALMIAHKLAEKMLTKLGIDYLYNHKPSQMSGGEQQRVAIARALIGNPDILLADEPTGSLDSKTGKEIMDLFISLNEIEKKTVIMITHDVNISRQCKRVVSIKDGRLVSL